MDGVGKGKDGVVVEGDTLGNDVKGVWAEVRVGEGDGDGVHGRR